MKSTSLGMEKVCFDWPTLCFRGHAGRFSAQATLKWLRRFLASLSPLTRSLSPSDRERVAAGRVRVLFIGCEQVRKEHGAFLEPGGARLRRTLSQVSVTAVCPRNGVLSKLLSSLTSALGEDAS